MKKSYFLFPLLLLSMLALLMFIIVGCQEVEPRNPNYIGTITDGSSSSSNPDVDIWKVYSEKNEGADLPMKEAWFIANSTCILSTPLTGVWMGIGIRVNPYNDSNLRDLSTYDYLNFMYKGTKGFKVGMRQTTTLPNASAEIWMTNTQLATHIVVGSGDLLDGTWHTIQIPFSLFGIDFAQIAQYFMFVSDAGLGYNVGDVHYIDHVYYSSDE